MTPWLKLGRLCILTCTRHTHLRIDLRGSVVVHDTTAEAALRIFGIFMYVCVYLRSPLPSCENCVRLHSTLYFLVGWEPAAPGDGDSNVTVVGNRGGRSFHVEGLRSGELVFWIDQLRRPPAHTAYMLHVCCVGQVIAYDHIACGSPVIGCVVCCSTIITHCVYSTCTLPHTC